MKDNLKYLIIGISIIISVSIYVYFSPYHSCVRATSGSKADKAYYCAKHKY
ncbi:hypothetical protein MCEME17_00366 [Candidatus Pelagibacterales bacterium]|jgi:hypothetical protein